MMQSSRPRPALLLSIWLLTLASCSILVNPDPSLLGQADSATNMPDNVAMPDTVPRPDVVRDVPGMMDVPGMNDVPIRPDAPAMCPPSCDDGIPCTVDACNPMTLQCTHVPNNLRCPMNYVCDPRMGCVRR